MEFYVAVEIAALTAATVESPTGPDQFVRIKGARIAISDGLLLLLLHPAGPPPTRLERSVPSVETIGMPRNCTEPCCRIRIIGV